jgi:flagellar secretion chaperone FliS
MVGYQSPAHQYREIAVKTASPLQLVIILYDAAICATKEAREKMDRKDISGRSKAINKCLAIISELQSCLNLRLGGEIADSLNRLYNYMKARIFRANVDQSSQPLIEIETLLENLRSAWAELAKKGTASAQSATEHSRPNRERADTAGPTAAQPKSLNISI